MASHRLGQWYEGFASFRRMLAKATAEAQPIVFSNCLAEAAGYVRQGLDRAAAADELADMAASIGWDDADEVQAVVARTFAEIERGNGPDSGEEFAEQVPDDGGEFDNNVVDLERAAGAIVDARRRQAKLNGGGIPLIFPFPIDGAAIPRRPWIVPGLLLRGHVTMLVAPPGSGKSLLTLQVGMMCAAPLAQWAGWRPRMRARVMLVNSEEDGNELRRRLWAAAKVMGIEPESLRDTLSFAEDPEDIVIAKADSRTKTVVRTPTVERIVATIRERQIDILIVDPFAETFIGDENSNSELKWAAVLWREVARSTGVAVLLVHHAKKYSSAMAGDMDAARGGGALAGVARIVCTLFAMTEEEAAELIVGIDDPRDGSDRAQLSTDDRGLFLRFDNAKANLTLLTGATRWFVKLSQQLENGGDGEPADEVGVLKPWNPPTAFDNMSEDQARAILDEIARGPMDDDGEPTGDYFLLGLKGKKPKNWAGDIIQRTLACTDKQARLIIGKWRKASVLETFTAKTPQGRGHSLDNNVRVNPARRPGIISHVV